MVPLEQTKDENGRGETTKKKKHREWICRTRKSTTGPKIKPKNAKEVHDRTGRREERREESRKKTRSEHLQRLKEKVDDADFRTGQPDQQLEYDTRICRAEKQSRIANKTRN